MTTTDKKNHKKRGIDQFFQAVKKKTKIQPTEVTEEKELKTSVKTETENTTESTASIETVLKYENKFSETVDPETQTLLENEMHTIEPSWFENLESELVKPYFIELKKYLETEYTGKKQIFPSPENIYSWSRLTPFKNVRVLIIGQDPYHNINQAHGLAFSVQKPTVAPPSLKNIYKELKNHNYPDFEVDNKVGDLTKWSEQGVLLLNTCLTVRAHEAFSHSKKGWEVFTKRVIELLIEDRLNNEQEPICFILWGSKAQDLVYKNFKHIDFENKKNFLMLKSVHPSPLSASRGFFGCQQFKKCNDWLFQEFKQPMIDWSVVDGNQLSEVQQANASLQ